jgi:hypothetical protein
MADQVVCPVVMFLAESTLKIAIPLTWSGSLTSGARFQLFRIHSTIEFVFGRNSINHHGASNM